MSGSKPAEPQQELPEKKISVFVRIPQYSRTVGIIRPKDLKAIDNTDL